MIRFNCPSCGTEISIPDNMAGQSGKCNACGAQIMAPGPPTMLTTTPEVVKPKEPVHIRLVEPSIKPKRSSKRRFIRAAVLLIAVAFVIQWIGRTNTEYEGTFQPSIVGAEKKPAPSAPTAEEKAAGQRAQAREEEQRRQKAAWEKWTVGAKMPDIGSLRGNQVLYCAAGVPIHEWPDTNSRIIENCYGYYYPMEYYTYLDSGWYVVLKGSKLRGYIPNGPYVVAKSFAGAPPDESSIRSAVLKKVNDPGSTEFDDPMLRFMQYEDGLPVWFIRLPFRSRNAFGGMVRAAFWGYFRHSQYLDGGIDQ